MSVETDLTALSREIAGLCNTIGTLGRGLSQMLEVQATHTAMLQRLLMASASPADDEVSLGEMIGQLIGALKHQNTMMGEVKTSIDHLPTYVGTAVSEAVRDVLAQL
ncbi:hypothetical protein [Acidiphilium multivorum]|uniref:hypothetical protein n=1 Tax=Acidiphilium multivorum TaxID=62140 RepID=UPI001B8CFF4B|nr:hypothetical protein [Acidiphilium multivorum]MBS3025249.1 hypothetical protein [Acidiphilium multivorum]